MTKSMKLMRALGFCSLFVLAGCGGDGGVNGASTVVASAPPPAPVTPSNLSPSTSFSNTMQNGNFVTIRASGTTTIDSNGKISIAANPADSTNYISYDAASNAYTVNYTDSLARPAKLAFDRSGSGVTVKLNGTPDPTEVSYSFFSCFTSGCYSTDNILTHTGTSGFKYTYTALASYIDSRQSSVGGSTTIINDFSVFGFPTPTSAVPRTGSATYSLDLMGTYTGTGSGSVNFGSGTYNFSGTIVSNTSYVQTNGTFQSTGTLANANNGFSGTVSLTINQTLANPAGSPNKNAYTFSGPIGGMFFGPTAQELGGTFVAPNTSATSTISGASTPSPVYGAILGHR